jgi:hypothetical protein
VLAQPARPNIAPVAEALAIKIRRLRTRIEARLSPLSSEIKKKKIWDIYFVIFLDQASSLMVAYPGAAFMNLKLIVAILVIAAMPAYAQPKKPSATNVTTDAQKVVKIISGDKARTQTYCDIGKLGDQIEEAEQKKDMNKIDELNKKMDELATKLGPEYAALMSRLQDIDPNSKEALEVGSGLEALDKLCAK